MQTNRLFLLSLLCVAPGAEANLVIAKSSMPTYCSRAFPEAAKAPDVVRDGLREGQKLAAERFNSLRREALPNAPVMSFAELLENGEPKAALFDALLSTWSRKQNTEDAAQRRTISARLQQLDAEIKEVTAPGFRQRHPRRTRAECESSSKKIEEKGRTRAEGRYLSEDLYKQYCQALYEREEVGDRRARNTKEREENVRHLRDSVRSYADATRFGEWLGVCRAACTGIGELAPDDSAAVDVGLGMVAGDRYFDFNENPALEGLREATKKNHESCYRSELLRSFTSDFGERLFTVATDSAGLLCFENTKPGATCMKNHQGFLRRAKDELLPKAQPLAPRPKQLAARESGVAKSRGATLRRRGAH